MVNSIRSFRKIKIYTYNSQTSIQVMINVVYNIKKVREKLR